VKTAQTWIIYHSSMKKEANINETTKAGAKSSAEVKEPLPAYEYLLQEIFVLKDEINREKEENSILRRKYIQALEVIKKLNDLI